MFGSGRRVLVGCWGLRDCLGLESWWGRWRVRRGLERRRLLRLRNDGGFGSDRRVGRGEGGGGRGEMGGGGSRLAFCLWSTRLA